MLLLLCVAALAAAAWAGDKPSAKINFLVVKDYNGKPVRNAAVILHAVDRDGHQSKGGLELKTDMDGKTSIEGIPFGTVRVQVIAHGFQTFGQDFAINQATHEFTIKLQPPQGQYSIYK